MANRWTDRLNSEVYGRLCNCRSRKSDLEALVNARWAWLRDQGKDRQGYTREDALVQVLEIVDCNGQCIDLTVDEYDELKREA